MTNQSRLTTSRAGRLGILGKLAGGIAGGIISEGARQLSKGNRPSASQLLLSPGNLNRVGDKLAEMRGAAMKVGQLLSMDSGSILPPELSELLAHLRDNAHSMPLGEVAEVLNQAWGSGWENQFERFHFTPVAAASIGQVHRATLKDGREVAVKIQYPGVRRSIDSDVDNVASLLRLTRLVPSGMDLDPLLDEAKRQLHREADYHQEAIALNAFASRLANDPRFEVPKVFDHLSNEQVLTMSYLDGQPIESLRNESQPIRDRVATALMELSMREVFEWGLVQTDPNFANYRYQPETGVVQLLDFGATREYPSQRLDAFRQLLLACLSENQRAEIIDGAMQVGYLDASDSDKYRDCIVELLHTATEPARHEAGFSFASDKLADRMREIVFDLRATERFARVPPVDILFLHRKLGGLYLLFSHLRAEVPVRSIASDHLPGLDAESINNPTLAIAV